MTLIIKTGERVLCENGHLIARATRDVHMCEPTSASKLEFVEGEEPSGASPMETIKCSVCGGRWLKQRPGTLGTMLHVEGEWR
jgi:hypothetical protein